MAEAKRTRRTGSRQDTPHDLSASLAKISWSYSRRTLLEQCSRRYYYEYYGANKRLAKSEPDKETLHRLKGMQSRYLRGGSLLHLAISTYMRKAQDGETWDVERLIRWVSGILAEDQQYSRAHPDGDGLPKLKYPPVLLLEYHQRLPEADQLLAETQVRLAQALRTFMIAPIFGEFRVAGSRAGALVEQKLNVDSLPCRVSGKLDLAYCHDMRATVVDWKLGGDDGFGNNSLQLAVYGLWAAEYFDLSPDQLEVYKAHLGSGELVGFRVDEGVLLATRARIFQDAERMAALEAYGRSGVAQAFTPCQRPAVCRLCPYTTVCLSTDPGR